MSSWRVCMFGGQHNKKIMNLRLGIDLGGTKIELIALDDSGHEVCRKRVPTPQEDYEATLRTVSGLVLEFESNSKKHFTVGIGIPGALSRVTGLVKNANSTCLIGRDLKGDLKGDLEKALGREVRIENDANCCSGRTPSRGSGATTRCRWRRIFRVRKTCLCPTVTAGEKGASRPTCRGRRWKGTARTLITMRNAWRGRWPE